MKNNNNYIPIIIAIVAILFFEGIVYIRDSLRPKINTEVIEYPSIDTMVIDTLHIDSLSINNVKSAIIAANVQYPDIVLAQAILETGYFNSKVCKEYNNLFGLYDSRNMDYYKFDHWKDSIEGYKKYVERKYNPLDDYYVFLKELPYAMDPEYISKIKIIVKRNARDN